MGWNPTSTANTMIDCCTIAMYYSSLCCWQRLSGGENRHKQSGLLQKTDNNLTCKIIVFLEDYPSGEGDDLLNH